MHVETSSVEHPFGPWICPLCERHGSSELCAVDGAACVRLEAPRSNASLIRAGMVIGSRYRIERLLGRGGFAVVFGARHLGTGQGVALKVMSSSHEDDGVALRRFFREARVTAGLRHPSTVRVFDFGQEENGLLYLAMELLNGRTIKAELDDRLLEGRVFTESEAIEVALAVTQSLAEAHAFGLVHRDLKPSNLFMHRVLGNEPVIKVLDFGIAKVSAPALTRADRSVGTAAFMSPEQTRDEPLDGRSDLYSLGLILHALVSGTYAFKRATPLEAMLAHAREEAPDLRVHARTPLSEAFVAIVERALAKAPADRFADAQHMRRALQECASPVDVQPRRSWRKVVAAIAFAGLMGAARGSIDEEEAPPPPAPLVELEPPGVVEMEIEPEPTKEVVKKRAPKRAFKRAKPSILERRI